MLRHIAVRIEVIALAEHEIAFRRNVAQFDLLDLDSQLVAALLLGLERNLRKNVAEIQLHGLSLSIGGGSCLGAGDHDVRLVGVHRCGYESADFLTFLQSGPVPAPYRLRYVLACHHVAVLVIGRGAASVCGKRRGIPGGKGQFVARPRVFSGQIESRAFVVVGSLLVFCQQTVEIEAVFTVGDDVETLVFQLVDFGDRASRGFGDYGREGDVARSFRIGVDARGLYLRAGRHGRCGHDGQ